MPKKRPRVLFLVLMVVTLVAVGSRILIARFVPPDKKTREDAIGATQRLSRPLQRAFDPGDAFDPIPTPGPSDWLASHPEMGQTFPQFVRGGPNRPDQRRNKIYLQPLGEFPESASPDIERLRTFAEAFFALPVVVQEPVVSDALPIKSRVRDEGFTQILSTDVLEWLSTRVPEDAFCLLALTMTDLYPQESWNFVFGQATLRNRVGVYSFARYDPKFYGGENAASDEELVLLRSCKVLAHETGHMFGIKHCVHFHCLMNGSNHLQETDRQPCHLCPVCLRKLQSSVGFDVVKRYRKLEAFADSAGFEKEQAWLSKRLKTLEE